MTTDAKTVVFSPLNLCLIVEAHFSARQLIIGDAKSNCLFAEVREAKSLQSASAMLAIENVDCCIIGASLTLEKATGYLEKSRTIERAKDCAFIALIDEEGAARKALLDAGAHLVLQIPCSKQALGEAIIRAVAKANENSPWCATLRRAELDGIDPFAALGIKKEMPPVSISPIEILKQAAPQMKNLAARMESGELDFLPDGMPSPVVISTVSEIIESLFVGKADQDGSKEFKKYFYAALLQWLMNLRALSQREATEIFRQTLMVFDKERISSGRKKIIQ